MPPDGVYMNTEAVETMARTFNQFGSVLRTVSKGMEIAMTTLKVTAFVGMVGGAALEHYLATMKPKVDKLSNKCFELDGDLMGAVSQFRDGDISGSKHFQY